jgi:hypothetical protein
LKDLKLKSDEKALAGTVSVVDLEAEIGYNLAKASENPGKHPCSVPESNTAVGAACLK